MAEFELGRNNWQNERDKNSSGESGQVSKESETWNWREKEKFDMEEIATVLRLKILFISQLFTKEVAVYKRELEKILTTFFPRVL